MQLNTAVRGKSVSQINFYGAVATLCQATRHHFGAYLGSCPYLRNKGLIIRHPFAWVWGVFDTLIVLTIRGDKYWSNIEQANMAEPALFCHLRTTGTR